MFLKTNDRMVNLSNVSNINIISEYNSYKFRIVFNMNYSIEINTRNGKKQISDYVYWDCINKKDMNSNIEYISNNKYFKENFIQQANGEGFINKNEISSIKFSDKKCRVIFNLSHPVTFKDFSGDDKITSEFVYVNCDDFSQYTKYVEYINFALKLGE